MIQSCYRDALTKLDKNIKVGVIEAGDGCVHGTQGMTIFTRIQFDRHAGEQRCP